MCRFGAAHRRGVRLLQHRREAMAVTRARQCHRAKPARAARPSRRKPQLDAAGGGFVSFAVLSKVAFSYIGREAVHSFGRSRYMASAKRCAHVGAAMASYYFCAHATARRMVIGGGIIALSWPTARLIARNGSNGPVSPTFKAGGGKAITHLLAWRAGELLPLRLARAASARRHRAAAWALAGHCHGLSARASCARREVTALPSQANNIAARGALYRQWPLAFRPQNRAISPTAWQRNGLWLGMPSAKPRRRTRFHAGIDRQASLRLA